MKHLVKFTLVIAPFLLMLGFLTLTTSCEEPIEVVIRDTVFIDSIIVIGDDPEVINPEADALLNTAYARWIAAMYNNQGHAHAVETFTGDISMLPTRGSDWFDDGKWVQTHQHLWTPSHKHVEEAWNDYFNGLSEAIAALTTYESKDFPEQEQIGQAKALVAYNMYHMLNLFGKFPLDRNNDGNIVIMEGQTAFDAIETLLREAIGHMEFLNSTPAESNRFTSAGAMAMMARLYLNKSIFLNRYAVPTFDAADMDSVYKYTNEIIVSGAYALETDYFRMFDVENGFNSEFILVAEQFSGDDRAFGRGDIAGNQLERNQKLDPEVRGSNGGCVTPDFFNSWDQTDPRFFERHIPDAVGVMDPANYTDLNRGILHGQQYGPVLNGDGSAFETDGSGNFMIQALVMDKNNSIMMDFTPEVTDITGGANGLLNQGARISKYQLDVIGGRRTAGFDIPLIRLADIYLMRAEARLRGASSGDALADVNAVRTARVGQAASGTATLAPLGSIDLDGLLAERAFELYWEPHRRTDLIRFGQWESPWTEKSNADVNKRVLPIFEGAIADFGTLGLTQNQGY